MQVRDVMRKDPETVGVDATVGEVAARAHAAPVAVVDGEKVVGVVTPEKLAGAPHGARMRDVLEEAHFVFEDVELANVARTLRGPLLVFDRTKRLVGTLDAAAISGTSPTPPA